MEKSYKGVKSEKRCEIVTVGRRAARGGESRSHQTWSKVVATASHESGSQKVQHVFSGFKHEIELNFE